MCAADITADKELCRNKADQNKVELTWTNIEKSDESIVKDTLQWTLQCREKEEREIEGLFSTIQQYSCGNCEQQHKVEGCQKGTRPKARVSIRGVATVSDKLEPNFKYS